MAFSLRCLKYLRLYTTTFPKRLLSSTSSTKRGLVLGVYSEECKSPELTFASEAFNKFSNGKLLEVITLSGNEVKEGKTFVFWGLHNDYQSVAVVGLGKKGKGYDDIEIINQDREAIRIASAAGCKALKDVGMQEISVESFGDAEAAAEGSILASWKYQDLKTKKDKLPQINLYDACSKDCDSWNLGLTKANAQNLARKLADTPSNLMTPTIFCEDVEAELCNLDVKVEVHDKEWAECLNMCSFLSVSKGSVEPPKFLELTYNKKGKGNPPFVLIGKGVTFDSGGISIKPSSSMDEMRADMSGAACVVATLKAIATLKLETHLKVLIPLTENMPSGSATKPGDVVRAMNGKTICIDNTDAEGRLILADALCYSKCFNPLWILDIATLTGAMRVALGNSSTGVFTNSNALYDILQKSGANTGDRMWRFPLWKHFTKQVTDYPEYDVNNVGKGKGGGACSAAAFLKEFVPEDVNWMHLDIAGVMGPKDEAPYLSAGMTGRPTRTLIDFIQSQILKK